jgi:phosphoribosylaminoimidazole carboxylase (NCAIR synthetase)
VAVEEERFERARRLKDAIAELGIIGPTLGALEVEKRRFVEKQVRRHRQCRVARFFLVQHTQSGKDIPNILKIYQMAVK